MPTNIVYRQEGNIFWYNFKFCLKQFIIYSKICCILWVQHQWLIDWFIYLVVIHLQKIQQLLFVYCIPRKHIIWFLQQNWHSTFLTISTLITIDNWYTPIMPNIDIRGKSILIDWIILTIRPFSILLLTINLEMLKGI